MENRLVKNTLVLTLTYQILRVIGIYFTAYLSDTIGTEGVGLYQLIVSVYVLAATFASSGLGVAVSRLTAESVQAGGHKTTSNALQRAAVLGVGFSLVFGIVLYACAVPIGNGLLGDPRAIPSIRMLAPGLPFMALSNCLQGYFYGLRKVIKPASQMLFEQASRLLIIMAVIGAFTPRGLEYACFGIIFSCMISEVLSCAYAFLLYLADRRKERLVVVKQKHITRKILGISVPIALSAYVRTLLRTAENMLIPAGLRKHGTSHAQALSQFGMVGMALPILFFPSGLWTAVGTLLVPELSAAAAVRNTRRIRTLFSGVFALSVLPSLLFCAIFIACGPDFGLLIYRSAETGRLIAALAPLVPLLYLDFIVDSMLSGLDQQVWALKINLMDSALRVVLIFSLVPAFGFGAYVTILYISALVNGTLSIRRLLIASGGRIRYMDWIIKPLLCAATAALSVRLLFVGAAVTVVGLLIKIALLCTVYTALLFAARCIGQTELEWLKKATTRGR